MIWQITSSSLIQAVLLHPQGTLWLSCASFRLWLTRMDDAVTHCPQCWPLTPADCQTCCYNQPQTDDTCRDEAFSKSCSTSFYPDHRLSAPFVSEAQLVASYSLAGTVTRELVVQGHARLCWQNVLAVLTPLASVALSRALGCTAGERLPSLASAAFSHRVPIKSIMPLSFWHRGLGPSFPVASRKLCWVIALTPQLSLHHNTSAKIQQPHNASFKFMHTSPFRTHETSVKIK